MRITKGEGKIAYTTAALVVLLLVSLTLTMTVSPVVGVLASVVLWIAIVAVGTRVFRGAGEPVAPPRPWWRMSAQPTAGFVLAAFFLLNAVSQLLPIALGRAGLPEIAILLGHGAIGAAYLNSSLRLRRLQRADAAGAPSLRT